MKPEFHLHVIDKNSAGAVKRIGKRDLSLLVHMLEDLKHTAAAGSKARYGYHEDAAQWDAGQLQKYKTDETDGMSLISRLNNKNYTFFMLKDNTEKTVALISGNAPHPDDKEHKQLRAMNITVGRDYPAEEVMPELLKQVAHWAAKNKFDKILFCHSDRAQDRNGRSKSELELCEQAARAAGLDYNRPTGYDPLAPVDAKTPQIEATVAPKRFAALDEQEREARFDKSGGRIQDR